jgi:hypothetical protein
MKNLLHRIRNDNRGSTMVEAVTTMFIMTVILPLFIIMISTALNTREVSTSLMSNTVNTAGVQNSLNNDIETASAVKVVAGNFLNLRSQDGSCKAWKIKDGSLVRAASDTAITDSSNWLAVGEYFAPIESTDIFQKDSVGTVGYNFKVGKAAVMNELRGSATQASASSGSGDCW